MPSFAQLLQQGAANAWLFAPSAILLGALHGLEPGHSKTMMAAFIVAIRGTIAQAIMLGLAATISHTAVVWGIALGGMYLWRDVAPESFEPWFQLLSGLIIIGVAFWMIWRTWSQSRHAHDHHHDHGHDYTHGHGDERRIDTGHGTVSLEVFEDGVPPRWRLRSISGSRWHARDVVVTTTRPDGTTQVFKFRDRDGYVESFDEIPEPHQFTARLSLGHGGHSHDYDLTFTEDHAHGGLDLGPDAHEDAHARAHAADIRRRFADRSATNGQIILFGLTGGLIPCPAAITVLLLCLQVNEFTLGAALVLCFSIGLALTLVTVGVAAAYGVRHATRRFTWFSTLAQRAPYFSGGLIILVGLYVSAHGASALMRA